VHLRVIIICTTGDFNEIVNSREKVGMIRNATQMSKFRSTMEDCNLGDLGCRGSKFTWSNKRGLAKFIKERLDRVVATSDWCAHFTNLEVEILPASTSDHRPLYLKFDSRRRISSKLFHFEAKWNLGEECSTVVKEAWTGEGDGRPSLGSTWRKLGRCKTRFTGMEQS
jgi:hypothetical protein